MFGFLKNLLGRSGNKPVQTAAPASPSYQAATGTTATGGTNGNSSGNRNGYRGYLNGNANGGSNGNGNVTGNGNGNGQPRLHGSGVEVPLQPILDALPLELQDRVRVKKAGDLSITIPLDRILAQLAQGIVRIPFGEVRQAVPHVFTGDTDLDNTPVPLPLSEVLPRINPALIKRRRTQRRVQVPDEVSSPFGENGINAEVSFAPMKQEAPAAPAVEPLSRTNPAFQPRPVSSPASRMNTLTPPPPVPPSAGPATPRIPLSSSRLGMVAPPAPPVAPAPPAPAAPSIPLFRPALDQATQPQSPAPVPQALKPAPQPAVAQVEADPIVVGLVSIAESWPDVVKKEIVQLKLVDAKIALPAEAVERALRQGRISFSWRSLRSWIKPSPLPTVSAQDATVLDLPLKVIAPLFLSRQREASKAQQRVAIDDDIPNLFFGMPQGETIPPTGAANARPADTNFYVWDDASDSVRQSEATRSPSAGTRFLSKYATPNEIVSRTAALDGVAGALIALPDGLLVASQLSKELNADDLAAFLPQIFGKVSQTTKELRMGDLNNLNFTVGNIPWKIFRVNAIFFAAFGKAGEPLPTAQLVALAAELDHKPK